MNRLIIIGNGFDLAHGIRTSYKHFVMDYFYKILNYMTFNKPYNDELLKLKVVDGHYYYAEYPNRITPENSLDYIKKILEGGTIFSLEFKSLILKNSLDKIEKMNWVDLELEYFEVLLDMKNKTNTIEAIQIVN